MPLAEPKFYLRPNETVKAEDRIQKRWILRSLLTTLIVLGVFTAIIAAVEQLFQVHPPWVWPTWAAIFLFFVVVTQIAAWRRVVTTEYVITDETAYARTGRLILRLESVPMDKLTDITVHTSLLGRVMGYSTLYIRTAGGAILFVGLADAYRLRESVQDQRKGFIRRLLEEAGRGREADRVAEDGPADAKATRCRCPACEHAFDAPPERPVDVTCPRCGLEGTLFEPEVAAA